MQEESQREREETLRMIEGLRTEIDLIHDEKEREVNALKVTIAEKEKLISGQAENLKSLERQLSHFTQEIQTLQTSTKSVIAELESKL
jgi:chromosome segregation ATPase